MRSIKRAYRRKSTPMLTNPTTESWILLLNINPTYMPGARVTGSTALSGDMTTTIINTTLAIDAMPMRLNVVICSRQKKQRP